MPLIAQHLNALRSTLPEGVLLLAVSKYHTIEDIREAYDAGCRDFGESRVQELKLKQAALPSDIRWHFIGHLQTNKVRDLLRLRPYLIHSVDSLHLLQAIDAEAAKQGIVQDILLELHVAREETKTGFSPDELHSLFPSLASSLGNADGCPVRVMGIMGMATNTGDEQEIRRCFHILHDSFLWLQSQAATTPYPWLCPTELSMGMSDDYTIAVSEGATIVRIGAAIFA